MRRPNLTSCLAIAALLLALPSVTAARVIYTDADATGANDGSSWANAYRYLQDALADANSSEKPVEIRVAEGIYQPDQGAGATPCDREATFQLINGVTLKGGYAGFGERDPNARDISAYDTILSGDLGGDDVEVANPFYLSSEKRKSRRENTLHVVTGNGMNVTAGLDGFTVTGGNDNRYEPGGRDGTPIGFGGGMCNESGSPTVTNCIFSANSASRRGGAIYNHKSSPTLTNCTFSANSGGWGVGGGMYNSESSPTLTNCVFTGNAVVFDGGGMANFDRSVGNLRNCTFSGNQANYGGAVYNYEADLTLTNCTFTGNRRSTGRALASTGTEGYLSSAQMSNCIFWGGVGEILNNRYSTIEIAYCDVRGGQTAVYDPCEGLAWGEGNMDTDPCFVDPGYWDDKGTPDNSWDDTWVNGDYHVKSQAGRYDPNTETWVKDDATSPCIDAGDIGNPIDYEPFPNGGIVNMGAYGGTAEASKSYFGEPVCETIVAGDINGDCTVNFKDFALMAIHWLEDNTLVNSDSVVKDGIEYYIYTDKSIYHLGENVEILYRVTNLQEVSVDVGDVPNCAHGWSDLTITDERATDVWQHLRSIPPCGWTMLHVEPYDSKEHQFAWDMVSDNGTFGVHDDDYLVGAGSYKITGQLRLSNAYKHKRVPVSVSIEIRP